MLALQDNYFSFASGTNLKYPSMFAKNQITAMGDSDITKFVSATGSSNMLDYLSILGVKQLASSSTLQSASKGTSSIHTGITQDSLTNPVYKSSLLQGRQLRFGTYSGDQYQSAGIFTFPSSYKDKDGDGKDITVPIDYTIDLDAAVEVDGVSMTGGEKLAMQLNKALSQSGIKSGEDSISDVMEFVYADGKMQLQAKAGKTTNLVINSSSSALTALGYNPKNADGTDKTVSDGISLSEFNENQKQLNDTYVNRQTMTQYLTGKKLTISFGGQTKEIELVKSGDTFADLDDLKGIIQGRLNQAFGTDNIKVAGGTRYGADGNPVIGTDGNPVIDPLSFELGSNASSNQTLTVTSDNAEIRNVLGIQKGASNKLNLEGSIRDNIDKLIPDGPDAEAKRTQFLNTLETDGLVINGVKISGVTAGTSIQGMIDKINTNKDVGVKASYLSSTNQFVLISSETGSGREIQLEGASADIFGAVKDADGNYTDGNFEMGKNAQVLVSYGNGISTMIESSSNTFDLEGLRVTVSQEFGNVTQDASGGWNSDRSKAVTFSAKADVDGVTETVKKFVEEYNEMIKEINTQVTTRPDKAYGPLTEEQKDEMSEKSIENWEKKAKQGLLYNDATMRALSLDMQGVLTRIWRRWGLPFPMITWTAAPSPLTRQSSRQP